MVTPSAIHNFLQLHSTKKINIYLVFRREFIYKESFVQRQEHVRYLLLKKVWHLKGKIRFSMKEKLCSHIYFFFVVISTKKRPFQDQFKIENLFVFTYRFDSI